MYLFISNWKSIWFVDGNVPFVNPENEVPKLDIQDATSEEPEYGSTNKKIPSILNAVDGVGVFVGVNDGVIDGVGLNDGVGVGVCEEGVIEGVGEGLLVILGVTVGVWVTVGVGVGVTQEKVVVISQEALSTILITTNGLFSKICGIGTFTGVLVTPDNDNTHVIWFMSQTYIL